MGGGGKRTKGTKRGTAMPNFLSPKKNQKKKKKKNKKRPTEVKPPLPKKKLRGRGGGETEKVSSSTCVQRDYPNTLSASEEKKITNSEKRNWSKGTRGSLTKKKSP